MAGESPSGEISSSLGLQAAFHHSLKASFEPKLVSVQGDQIMSRHTQIFCGPHPYTLCKWKLQHVD